MNAFCYPQLDRNEEEIRLLNLFPGKFDDKIRFSLTKANLYVSVTNFQFKRLSLQKLQETLPAEWRVWETLERRYFFENQTINKTAWTHPDTDFDSKLYQFEGENETCSDPQYEALSYAWGSLDDLETAYICHQDAPAQADSPMEITRNLACALKHLRYPDQFRTLWVDAVCINQQDDLEKSFQIKAMSKIYSRASRVIAWLGSETQGSKHALLVLQHLGRQIEYSRGWQFASPEATQPEWWRREFSLPFDDRTWKAITSLISRAWFGRLWVLQEMRFANKQAIVMCGRDIAQWPYFRRAILCLERKFEMPFETATVISTASTIAQPESLNLRRLLTRASTLQCSDPKDKVYGLLSLMPTALSSKISPDYSLSPAEVYQDMFLRHLEVTKLLELLPFCNLKQTQNFCPSWVPNWNFPKGHMGWFGRAAGRSVAKAKYIHPYSLKALGIHCTNIRTVGEVAPAGIAEISRVLQDWEPEGLLESNQPGKPGLADFIRLVVFGRLKDKFPEYSYPTLQSLLDEYQRNDSWDWLGPERLRFLKGYSFVTTYDGCFGLVYGQPRPDDLICVFLGCDRPVVLRSTQSGGLAVIGRIWIKELLHAQALLGKLPNAWEVQFRMVGVHVVEQYFNTLTKQLTNQDPRIGALTHEWELVPSRVILDSQQDVRFRNKVTGEMLDSDPRLLPDALARRGVMLQEFKLI